MADRILELSRELDHVKFALDQAAIVAITDQTGKMIYVNDKFCEISKYTRDELLGQNHRILNSGYHSRDYFTTMWRTISSGKIWRGDIQNRAKDGSHYWVSTTIVPFLTEEGTPYQYVAIRFKISEQKAAEEKLRVYAQELERSNQQLQDFASIAAHDLQEPLRKIRTFSDRLKLKAGNVLQGDTRDYLDRMAHAAKRMQTLIDDLLTYSRITTQGSPNTPVKLNQVIQDVLTDLELRIEQTQARIEITESCSVLADPLQMRQLFQNLIGNALKFHKPDQAPRIQISCKEIFDFGGSRACEIRVSDQGIGFDEKYLDRIFTIFQRLHGRSQYEGNGVGLAVCRRIVERHGGTLTAKSRPGEGATFIVQLPIR